MKLLKLLFGASFFANSGFMHSMQQENTSCAAATKSQSELNSYLWQAFSATNLHKFKEALTQGADPNMFAGGRPLLIKVYEAYRTNNLNMLSYDFLWVLLRHPKINVNLMGSVNQGTILHEIASHHDIEIAKLLFAREGVDVNKYDTSGDTPLHKAIYPLHDKNIPVRVAAKRTIELLLAHGADPDIKHRYLNNDSYAYIPERPELQKILKEGRAEYLKNIEDRKKLIAEQTGLSGPVSNIVSEYLVDPRTMPAKQSEQKEQVGFGNDSDDDATMLEVD